MLGSLPGVYPSLLGVCQMSVLKHQRHRDRDGHTWTGRYLDKEIPGQGDTWTGRYLDREILGQGYTWTGRYLDREISGQGDTWTWRYLDRETPQLIQANYWKTGQNILYACYLFSRTIGGFFMVSGKTKLFGYVGLVN